jgi:segregation and condensation protein B
MCPVPNPVDVVEAMLFASDVPLEAERIREVLDLENAAAARGLVDELIARYEAEPRGLSIMEVGGGYRMVTRPELAPWLVRLARARTRVRLSRPALETLAIIAYKQPVTRADIEGIRGVSCGGVVANLMERSLIKITGKAKVLGAPFLYGTTPEFLEYLGLNSLKDLPSMEELEALLEREAYPESAVDAEAVAVASEDADDDDDVSETMEGASETEALVSAPAFGAAGSDAEEAGQRPRPTRGAARLGPTITEPQNRPIDTEREPERESAESDDTPNTQQAMIDEREDDR